MSEIGSGSGSSYPGILDTNATIEVDAPNAGKTKAKAAIVNDLAACILAIETELGVDPAGSKATVVARLDQEHNADGSHKDSYVVTVSGSPQTVTGHKVFASGIDVGIWGIKGSATVAESGYVRPSGDGSLIFGDGNVIYTQSAPLKTKVINIGTWNMDSTNSVSIPIGTSWSNIRCVDVIIRRDDAVVSYPLEYSNGTTTTAGYYYIDGTDITLLRTVSGFFDGALFDIMGNDGNRGYVTISYI